MLRISGGPACLNERKRHKSPGNTETRQPCPLLEKISEVVVNYKGFMEEQKRLEELDKRYIWHPFTQMKDWGREKTIIVARGSGSYIEDVEGNRYLDGVSSLWVNIHGHRKREIDDAIKEQIDRISHCTMLGLSNTPAIRLAERLIKIMPGEEAG